MGVSRGPSIERVNVGPFRDDVAGNFTDATRRGARRFLRPPCRTGMLSSAGANTEDAPNWRALGFLNRWSEVRVLPGPPIFPRG